MASKYASALETGQIASVEVNQRALVEKILARYSGDFTVYREALQNADDANAETVAIRFNSATYASAIDTLPSTPLPPLKDQKIAHVCIENNGQCFRDEDWSRLKKIAEGNPDQDKIGAFGVGFFSFFSLADEPVVVSGKKLMGFFWKNGGDQLYVKTNEVDEDSIWTTFSLQLREEMAIPSIPDFCRFCCTALGFTVNVKNINLYFNQYLLCKLSKIVSPSSNLPVINTTFPSSPLKVLKVVKLEEIGVQIKSEIPNWILYQQEKVKKLVAPPVEPSSFASKMLSVFAKTAPAPSSPAIASLESISRADPLAISTSTLFFKILSSSSKVTPSTHFAKEMLRWTKKSLPSLTTTSLIHYSKAELEASSTNSLDIFSGLKSEIRSGGKIFIGFQTFQTTGSSIQVAGRLVSTVERESLDFQSPIVSDWNRELLWIVGITARYLYEREMEMIRKSWKLNGENDQLEAAAIHDANFFTFHTSTPSPIVGTSIATGFFSMKGLTIPSSSGPVPAQTVRLPNPSLIGLYKGAVVSKVSPKTIETYRERNLIADISLSDILNDLGTRSLTEEEADQALNWWISLANDRSYNASLLSRFQSAILLNITDPITKDLSVVPFNSYTSFLNSKIISADLPISSKTLPFSISKKLHAGDLMNVFKLQELSISSWIGFVATTLIESGSPSETNLLLSPHFSEKVLIIIAKSWTSIRIQEQQVIIKSLQPLKFLPTSKGARTAIESYFPNVVDILDLPIVTLPSGLAIKQNLEQFILALGVRKHVELQLVFSKLFGKGDWNVEKLVSYLASVDLSSVELERLRKTAWLPAVKDTKRFLASDLFLPSDLMVSLGLPILEWGRWKPTSDEAKFLFSIGLKKIIPLEKTLELSSSSNIDLIKRAVAFDYLISEWSTNSYSSSYSSLKTIPAFLPAIKNNLPVLLPPIEVYESGGSSCLGFAVIDPRYREHGSKFRCASNPLASDLVRALLALKEEELTNGKVKIFEYLSSQVSGFSSSSLATLKVAKIIPIQDPITRKSVITRPDAVFFSSSNSSIPAGLESLFSTIPSEISQPNCRVFLIAVGVRDQPPVQEIANMLVADSNSPSKFYGLCGGDTEKYLTILRMIAVNYDRFGSTLKSKMKLSSFFLGYKRSVGNDEDEDATLEPILAKPSSLVIIDDQVCAYLFATDLKFCPQETILEKLLESLGGFKLTRLVREDYRIPTTEPNDSKRSRELSQLVSERTLLFLADHKTQEKFAPEFLSKKGNLRVGEISSIEILRTLSLPDNRVVKHKSLATCRITEKNGGILILISGDQTDLFELAEGLCKILLRGKNTTNDTLLLNTILATPLKLLKKRGFNVDRILTGRRIEMDKKAQEETQLAEKRAQEIERKESDLEKLKAMFPDADLNHLRLLLQQSPLEESLNSLLDGKYPRESLPISKVKNSPVDSQTRNSSVDSQSGSSSTPPIPPSATRPGSDSSVFSNFKKKLLNKPETSINPAIRNGGGLGNGSSSNGNEGVPSSQKSIQENLLKAIQASKPETSSTFKNEVQKTSVKEAEGSYCDASAGANLKYALEMRGMKVYLDQGVDSTYFNEHRAALDRFIGKILQPIGQVFGLDPKAKAIHVFYDSIGPLIAFNRGGALYLNFRYYLAWHDVAVANNILNEALISWFHSLAHEISHNLIKPHDSAFSYYFSSLCEMHFEKMSALLQK